MGDFWGQDIRANVSNPIRFLPTKSVAKPIIHHITLDDNFDDFSGYWSARSKRGCPIAETAIEFNKMIKVINKRKYLLIG
jgi:hypothetical protein